MRIHMIKEVKTLEDLRDSHLLFDKKLPVFGYMFLWVVSVFFAFMLLWSIYTPKIYMIKAEGLVSSEGANQVMSGCTGEIIECSMWEGQVVEDGEKLFSIKDTGQIIKATASGVLHLYKDYKDGMIVQMAEPIAVITPENADTIIESYVPASDMAKIQEGDEVQIAVDGLTEAVYGNITGHVIHIDSNVTRLENENGTNMMFHIHILPEVEYLISSEGDKIDLMNGMTVEARIAYDKVTYFRYVLEKLGYKK